MTIRQLGYTLALVTLALATPAARAQSQDIFDPWDPAGNATISRTLHIFVTGFDSNNPENTTTIYDEDVFYHASGSAQPSNLWHEYRSDQTQPNIKFRREANVGVWAVIGWETVELPGYGVTLSSDDSNYYGTSYPGFVDAYWELVSLDGWPEWIFQVFVWEVHP